MALTFTFKDRNNAGKWIYTLYDVLLDNSYATGGYAISPGKVQLGVILGAQVWGFTGASTAATAAVANLIWDSVNAKLMAMRVATVTPAGTISAPTFTGSALAAHSHALWVATGATDATGARVNAASNSFAMNNAAASVAGIPAASGAAGGVVDITAGTPAGTVSAPTFTGTAVGQTAFAQVSNAVDLSAITVRMMFFGNK